MRAGLEERSMARDIGGSERWGIGGGLLRAREVVGASVVSRAGEALGAVEDIVLDGVRGCVNYAVLSFGGFMGMGRKLFAIPWRSFYVDSERHRLVLDLPREVLQNAPGFDPDSWPDMSDPAWQSRIQGYYGAEPIQLRTGADVEAGTVTTDIETRYTVGLIESATVEEMAEEPVQRELSEGRTVTSLEAGEDFGPEDQTGERDRKAA
jgi:sporulation protein YlmC with PRC-barrel domain